MEITLRRSLQSWAACRTIAKPRSYWSISQRLNRSAVRATCSDQYLQRARKAADIAFVESFRQASSYVQGQKTSKIVLVLPVEAMNNSSLLTAVIQDASLLQGMGMRLVLAVGSEQQEGQSASMPMPSESQATSAMQAAAFAQMELQRRLAQGHNIKMIRRHTRTFNGVHSTPAIHAVTGNWVLAKSQGIVNGQNLSTSGQVRLVEADQIEHQLDAGNLVILSSIGFSTSGQALFCDIYSVATAAAAALQADKLVCLTAPGMLPFQLPSWISDRDMGSLLNTLASEQSPLPGAGTALPTRVAGSLNVRLWQQCGLPRPLIATCAACAQGVKRAHLVDASIDGALLLEMYGDQGAGTMVSHDFHEGMRPATLQDLTAIQALLHPLEAQGVLLPRTEAQLLADLPFFCVMESRQTLGQVVGCAMVRPLAGGREGRVLGELGAFCTLPSCQGSGMGDSFLEWLEHEAQGRGITRLVLLTTRTGSWFADRGYVCAGLAHASRLLPTARRLQINMARNAVLFFKDLTDKPGLFKSQDLNPRQTAPDISSQYLVANNILELSSAPALAAPSTRHLQ